MFKTSGEVFTWVIWSQRTIKLLYQLIVEHINWSVIRELRVNGTSAFIHDYFFIATFMQFIYAICVEFKKIVELPIDYRLFLHKIVDNINV